MNRVVKRKFLVGIDEVGRGPLAGPISIGVCVIPKGFDKFFFKGIRDSKQLTPQKREEWYKNIVAQKKGGKLDFIVVSISSHLIDKRGLSWSIKEAIKRSLVRLKLNPDICEVFLDGGLKAPVEFANQQTIIKGDEKIPVIALASIVAKVIRDKKMRTFAKKYPDFGFEIHKGYGTLRHRLVLSKKGPCAIHRTSFIKKIIQK